MQRYFYTSLFFLHSSMNVNGTKCSQKNAKFVLKTFLNRITKYSWESIVTKNKNLGHLSLNGDVESTEKNNNNQCGIFEDVSIIGIHKQ